MVVQGNTDVDGILPGRPEPRDSDETASFNLAVPRKRGPTWARPWACALGPRPTPALLCSKGGGVQAATGKGLGGAKEIDWGAP